MPNRWKNLPLMSWVYFSHVQVDTNLPILLIIYSSPTFYGAADIFTSGAIATAKSMGHVCHLHLATLRIFD